MPDANDSHEPDAAGGLPPLPLPAPAAPTLDYGRRTRAPRRGNDPAGVGLGFALALLGLPLLGGAAWTARTLDTAYAPPPNVLFVAALVAGALCWFAVKYVRRDQPDLRAVARGFLRGVLVAALLIIGAVGLLAGTCFLMMRT